MMVLYYVLEIYRITLLSNISFLINSISNVLEIYRITLLSNFVMIYQHTYNVLEIYRITLLSNPKLNLRLKSNSGYHQV